MLTANELKKSNETDEKILAEIDSIKKRIKGFEKIGKNVQCVGRICKEKWSLFCTL